MSEELKKQGAELREKQGAITEEMAALKAKVTTEVAPLRAEREKVSLAIAALRKREKELSAQIYELETLVQGPRSRPGLGFSVTKPDGTKQKIK